MIRWCFVICFWIALIAPALAHEVRPAFLKLSENTAGSFEVSWKQPVISGKRLKLVPTFPRTCEQSAAISNFAAGAITETSTLTCDLKTGTIGIEGLERTLTDVFVEINYASGETRRELLKPNAKSFDLSSETSNTTWDYLKLGVEHIIFGWDHLLFVIGLALLVTRRQVWGVATAFTIAHSITLVLAAFGLLNIPIRPVEILIALSIVFLGIEVMRKLQGIDSLATRRPYLISFGIGLIHGCGFASALSEIGLPKGAELFALFLFNIGIELGQFAVIALALIVLALLARISLTAMRRAEYVTTYIFASIAMFWVIDRMKDYWV